LNLKAAEGKPSIYVKKGKKRSGENRNRQRRCFWGHMGHENPPRGEEETRGTNLFAGGVVEHMGE